ncbi:haloacid dehalogenase-like hydrolase [Aequorivita sp. H23M31]|uniref:phosphoserine phosphatase n=1 Tax=Aequorivita ciconiae TaxID=2494375 RepID=A0A410G6K4_9FLAO|nr:HAD family hydrolase [Aequorivita sp. H23M31]QAA82928.1 haloacid dehalogenase-like hydrolase [Aequorivita sp. H23M31]
MRKHNIIIFVVSLVLLSCQETKQTEKETTVKKEVLPSWNDSKSKSDIIGFVQKVTDSSSPLFVPVIDRIATFDNDGTLWTEQPFYFQLAYAFDEANQMIKQNPEMKNDPIFEALANGDMETIMSSGKEGVGKILMVTHTGIYTDQYYGKVSKWMETAKYPKSGKAYSEMIFQPMLEVIDYLKDNNFSVFIVSGGSSDFMRPWAENVYGIPKNNIIGTTLQLEYVLNDSNSPKLRILPEIGFLDDKEGKPMAIHQYIGRKPIAAFGNSDGDLQMLQWTDSNSYPSLKVYVHHTDGDREWKYDRDARMGKLDKGLDEALAKNWTVIDMAQDWKIIYPYELKEE